MQQLAGPLVDLVQNCLTQIYYVHTALANGILIPTNENMVIVEEYRKLVIGVCVDSLNAILPVSHACPLYPIEIWDLPVLTQIY